MVRYRYKRGRRGYRRSTNSIMMKFQSFMDISTKADEMQIISISAGGKNLLERLPAQFGAYKYYKIGNIAVKLVPASTLPVDPTGLSVEAGDSTVDPRDQLTPGLMRITNGEDVFEYITGMSATAQHQLYNSMMLDPRWYKWMLQSGVKRHAVPRYWQVGQLHQDKWPGATINVPQYTSNPVSGTDPMLVGTQALNFFGIGGSSSSTTGTSNLSGIYSNNSSFPAGFFQTGHKGVLGWLPTDGIAHILDDPTISAPPEIEVMKIILPPAYKTRYWYRVYITETCYFREPIVQAISTDQGMPYRPLDVFHTNYAPHPELPSTSSYQQIPDNMTGGNYGDD